jgi:hypothetical protein
MKVSILLGFKDHMKAFILKDSKADILLRMGLEENPLILKLLQRAQHILEFILLALQEYIQEYILRALHQHIQANILDFIVINIQAQQFLLSWNKMIILSGKE